MTLEDTTLTLATNGNDKIKVTFEVLANENITSDFTFIFDGNQFPKNIKNIEGDFIIVEVANEMRLNKGK